MASPGHNCRNRARTALLALLIATVLRAASAQAISAEDAEDLLQKEAGYIVDCSYTTYARNSDSVTSASDAYGCLNNVRVFNKGPDWVVPSEGAVGIIGLMQAARLLKEKGRDVTNAEGVIDQYFDTWLTNKRQPIVPDGVNAGAVVDRVYYLPNGAVNASRMAEANAGSTGITMVAMFKRYEYLSKTGRTTEAQAWLDDAAAWKIMYDGFQYIERNFYQPLGMVYTRPGLGDLWLTDATLAGAALKCLSAWASLSSDNARVVNTERSGKMSNNIVIGIKKMRDSRDNPAEGPNFYRLREAANNLEPTYGDKIDQICHLPYESGLLDAGDRYAHRISDWWTEGAPGGPRMTYQTNNSSDWRYFGTHWKYFFSGSPPSNNFLYPGPGLQLAKMELRTGKVRNEPNLISRANRRFQFAKSNTAKLWFGVTGETEADVPNGIVDWRDANDRSNVAPFFARFVDTSSYMIQVTLMSVFQRDTIYVPDLVLE